MSATTNSLLVVNIPKKSAASASLCVIPVCFWLRNAVSSLSGDSSDMVKIEYSGDGSNSAQPEICVDDSGESFKIQGDYACSKFLAREFSRKYGQQHRNPLYPRDAISATQVDWWMDYLEAGVSAALGNSSGKASKLPVKDIAIKLSSHLKLRSYFVGGYELSLADLAVWTALKCSKVWNEWYTKPEASAEVRDLLRWYKHISQLPVMVQAAEELDKLKQMSGPAKKQSTDQGSFDIALPNAQKGKVVTRFPPEASGYLHIGHAKAALLNQYFAQAYDGMLILRFDDTNPSKEKQEFEESIMEDLKLLEIKPDMITWTSDHFEKIYQLALDMISNGKAYVDDTDKEQMRAERMEGIASKNRDLSVEENLRLFKEEMSAGTEYGLRCCLRARISVDAKNKALRDPVIYRCNLTPHNRTSTKWKVYPTYDFSCPIVDSLEGVTHALRTNEYRDRNDQYYWIIKQLSLRKPYIWDYSRVNFVYTLLSKRKLQWFVDRELVRGWDDPRFPTVRGILRRGLSVQALKKYILMQGASKNTLLLEWDKLWAINKQQIDSQAPRYWAINELDACSIFLTNYQDLEKFGQQKSERQVPRHKKNPSLGEKTTFFSESILIDQQDAQQISQSEEITLMDWCNMIVDRIEYDAATSTSQPIVRSITGTLNPSGDFKKTKKKLTWLPKQRTHPVQLKQFDYLITKKKLEEGEKFEDFVNPETELSEQALGDVNLKELKSGEIIQLERRGYYRCERDNDSLTLISIPDGKASSTALKYEGDAGTFNQVFLDHPIIMQNSEFQLLLQKKKHQDSRLAKLECQISKLEASLSEQLNVMTSLLPSTPPVATGSQKPSAKLDLFSSSSTSSESAISAMREESLSGISSITSSSTTHWSKSSPLAAPEPAESNLPTTQSSPLRSGRRLFRRVAS